MTIIFLRRAGLAVLLLALFGTNRATAGPVYLYMTIDPPTTAGFGVPTVPRANSTGTFSVTSNKSGPGTFHLYALDSGTNSFGIAYFSIALSGTLSSVFNRSPIAAFDTLDDQGGSVGSGNAGYSINLLRSGVNPNPTVPIQGAQEVGSSTRIGGLGKTASNFNLTPNMPAVPAGGSRSWAAVTSGQWGNYATAFPTDPSGLGNKWLLLGEGNYSGQLPIIDYSHSAVLYYNAADFNSQDQASLGLSACLPEICHAPTVQDVDVNNVVANDPGLLTLTMSLVPPPPLITLTWSNLIFDSYVPAGGASGTGPATPATLSGNQFSWNTVGSPLGTYKWLVTASNALGFSRGSITVHITAVPEPATLSLLGFALAAICSGRRHSVVNPCGL